jgi:hypothetical protein
VATATAPEPTREDTHILTMSVDGGPNVGTLDLGIWDTKEGGEIDSDENKYKPGGMAKEISLGGTKTVGNLTFSRYYDWKRDDAIMSWMINRVGNGRGTLGIQMLDIHGNPQGGLLTYSGTLKTFTPPDLDSTSNDPAMLSAEFTIDTVSYA